MAAAEKAGGEAEYESDLDDAPLPAARRRAAASDDEEEEDEEGGGGSGSPPPSSTVFDSESDPDGQGAAELYDDDGDDGVDGTEEEEECGDLFEEREAGGGSGGGGGGEVELVSGEVAVAPEDEGRYVAPEDEGKYEEEESAVEGEEEEESMKGEEVEGDEAYAVPTAGAFYQHDTRFRGHQRQVFGGQKIWNPKEEAAWLHDRFNEINFHNSKSEYHDSVGIMQSVDSGYFEGTRSYSDIKTFDNVQTQPHSYYGNVKGYSDKRNVDGEKGSRTYQSHRMTSKSYSRSQNAEVSSNADVRKHSSQTLSLQHEQNLHCNQTFRSNASSAPPPFYSSRSSHQEFPFFPREKAQRVTFSKLFSSAVHKAGLQHEQTLPCKQTFTQREKGRVTFNKLFSSAVHKAHNSLTPQSHPILRRKAFVPSSSAEHGTAVYSHRIVPIDTMPCSPLHPMSTSHKYSKDSDFWDQGRDANVSETTIPCTEPQIAIYQQRSVQPPFVLTPSASAQKDTSTSKIRSHPQTTLISSSDDDEATAHPETNSSVVLSEVTVRDDMKEAGLTCFFDGGSLLVGDMEARSSTQCEPGSTSTPIKLPVMLFGGVRPMGPGFPSVSMILPGFVGQQRDGNSEMGPMTWLPILTGATEVQEGTSFPLNFGSNCPKLASSLASPRDHGATNDPISLTSQETPEGVSHEPVHHRNRTRRYSEMSFAL